MIKAALLASLFLISAWACPCRAISVRAPTFAKLVANAEQIARVEVTAVNSSWDGIPRASVIHTYVQCRVLRMLKGNQTDTITLRLLGGQVGDDRMEIPDMPSFDVGGTYIVFIAQNGSAFCPLVGVMHGNYRVVKNEATGVEHVARNSGEPLRAVADVVQPMTESTASTSQPSASGMSRDEFETAIAQQLNHVSN